MRGALAACSVVANGPLGRGPLCGPKRDRLLSARSRSLVGVRARGREPLLSHDDRHQPLQNLQASYEAAQDRKLRHGSPHS